jgi:exodeoxyribonuclease VII small subunit
MSEDKKLLSNFEVALKELEDIVAKMEKGGLSLEESINSFEQGVALTNLCQNILKKSEQKVQALMGQDLSPFEVPDSEEK